MHASRRRRLIATSAGGLLMAAQGTAIPAGDPAQLAAVTDQAFDTPARSDGSRAVQLVPALDRVGEESSLWLEVWINGRSRRDLLEVRLASDCPAPEAACFLVSATDWRQLGLRVRRSELDASRRVLLARLRDTEVVYDGAQQRLLLTVPPARFLPSTLTLGGHAEHIPDDQALNAVIGYDLFAQSSRVRPEDGTYNGVSGLFDGRLADDWGQLNQSVILRGGSGVESPLRRLDSFYRYDDPDTMTRWQAGDLISAGLASRPAVRMAGLQWRRDFSLRPDLVTFPLPDLSGQAAVPTTVDVLVNQMRRTQVEVAPGPFTLQQVPVLTGPSQVQLVVRDALGREQVTTLELFTSPQLLKPGLSDFAVQAGFLRERYATAGDRYDASPVASAAYRQGLSPTTTWQTQAELASDLLMLDTGFSGVLAARAQYDITLALSRDGAADTSRGGTGAELAARIDYYVDRQFVINASFAQASRQFRDLASRSAPDGRLLSRQQLGAFHPLGSSGTVGANWTRQRAEDGTEFSTLNVSATQRLSERLYASLTGWRTLDDESRWGAFLLLNWSVGPRENASLAYQRGDTGHLGVLSMQSSLPSDAGWGWRTETAVGNQGFVRGAVLNRNPYSDVTAELEATDTRISGRAGMAGAVAWMPGILKSGRQLGDAYALVDLGYPDVSVFVENRPVGRTDDHGRLLVSQLNPWQPNKLGIDPVDLPMDVEITSAERDLVPARGAGLRVDFDVRRQQNQLVALRHADGWAPVGTRLRLPDGSSRTVGYDGQVLVPIQFSGAWLTAEAESLRCRVRLPDTPVLDADRAHTLSLECP